MDMNTAKAIMKKKKMAHGGLATEDSHGVEMHPADNEGMPQAAMALDEAESLKPQHHDLALAEAIMHRKARERVQQEQHTDGPVNYAEGGSVESDEPGQHRDMMGTDSDDDEHLDNAMNSDEADDDSLSTDNEGSLANAHEYKLNEKDGADSLSSEYNNKKKSRLSRSLGR